MKKQPKKSARPKTKAGQTSLIKTTSAAKAALMKAPPFTVFDPSDFGGLYDPSKRRFWEIFEIGGTSDGSGESDRVEEHARKLGISFVDEGPLRDDEHAPKDFDDLDAGVQAIASGVQLVKIPDALRGKNVRYFRLYLQGERPTPFSSQSNVELPTRAGETVKIERHGLALTVKKLRRSEFFAKIDGEHRGRFGDARQIREDVEHFLETGALPRSSGGWH